MELNVLKDHNKYMSTIPDLAEKATMVATVEDMGVFINSISNFFTNRIEAAVNTFKGMGERLEIVDKKEYSVYIKNILKMQKEINHIIKVADLSKISKIQTPVTLGLKVDLLKLTMILKEKFTLIEHNLESSINETERVISFFISDHDYRISNRANKYKVDIYNIIDELEIGLVEIIDEHSVIDRKPLEEVIPSISSLKIIVKNILDIGHMSDVKKLNSMKSSIKVIYEKIDTLLELIRSNENMMVSKPRLHELGGRIEDIAKFITLATTYITLLNQTTDMLKNAVKLIEDSM